MSTTSKWTNGHPSNRTTGHVDVPLSSLFKPSPSPTALPILPNNLATIRQSRQRYHDYTTLCHDLTRQTRYISRTMLNNVTTICTLPTHTAPSQLIPLAESNKNNMDHNDMINYSSTSHYTQQDTLPAHNYADLINFHPLADVLVDDNDRATLYLYRSIYKQRQQYEIDLNEYQKKFDELQLQFYPQPLNTADIYDLLGPPPSLPPELPTRRIRFKQSQCPSYLLTQPHLEGLTLTPTVEEWSDPNRYIRDITLAHAYDHGIIRIIPPQHYQPPFSMDPDTTIFQTRTQAIGRFGTTGGSTISGREWTLSSYFHATQLYGKVIDDYCYKNKNKLILNYGHNDINGNSEPDNTVDELLFTQFPSPVPRRLKHLKDTILYSQKLHSTNSTAANIAQERIYLYQLQQQHDNIINRALPRTYNASKKNNTIILPELYRQQAHILQALSRVHDTSVQLFDTVQFWERFIQQNMDLEEHTMGNVLENIVKEKIHEKLQDNSNSTNDNENTAACTNTNNTRTTTNLINQNSNNTSNIDANNGLIDSFNHNKTKLTSLPRFTPLENKSIAQPTIHTNSLLYTIPTRMEHLPTHRAPNSTMQIFSWQKYYARRLILLGFLFSLQQDTLTSLSMQDYIPIMLEYLYKLINIPNINDNIGPGMKDDDIVNDNNNSHNNNNNNNNNNSHNNNNKNNNNSHNSHNNNNDTNTPTHNQHNNLHSTSPTTSTQKNISTMDDWAAVVGRIQQYYHLSNKNAQLKKLQAYKDELASKLKKRRLNVLIQQDQGILCVKKNDVKNAMTKKALKKQKTSPNSTNSTINSTVASSTNTKVSTLTLPELKTPTLSQSQSISEVNTPILSNTPSTAPPKSLPSIPPATVKKGKYGMGEGSALTSAISNASLQQQISMLTDDECSVQYFNPSEQTTLATTIHYEVQTRIPVDVAEKNGRGVKYFNIKNSTHDKAKGVSKNKMISSNSQLMVRKTTAMVYKELQPCRLYGDLFPFDMLLHVKNNDTMSNAQFILSRFIVFLQYVTQLFLFPQQQSEIDQDTGKIITRQQIQPNFFMSLFADGITAVLIQNSLLSPIPFPFPHLTPPKFHTTSELDRLRHLETIWTSAISYGVPHIIVEYAKDLPTFHLSAHPHPVTGTEQQTNPYYQDHFAPTWNDQLSQQLRSTQLLAGANNDNSLVLLEKPPQLGSSNATVLSEGWNPHMIAFLPGSLISSIGVISGITIPWAYIGSYFSSFPWHIEDDFLYSMSTNVTNAPKVWYGIASSQADYFEEFFSRFTTLGRASIHTLSNILSPQLLAAFGIKTTRLVQEPGHIILTTPRGYHSGFSAGFSCAEASNLAVTTWLPFGRFASMKYRFETNRESIFAIEMLIIRACLVEPQYHNRSILLNALSEIIQDQQEIMATFCVDKFLFQHISTKTPNESNLNVVSMSQTPTLSTTPSISTQNYTIDNDVLIPPSPSQLSTQLSIQGITPTTSMSKGNKKIGPSYALDKLESSNLYTKLIIPANPNDDVNTVNYEEHHHHVGVGFTTNNITLDLDVLPHHAFSSDSIEMNVSPHQVIQLAPHTAPIFIPLAPHKVPISPQSNKNVDTSDEMMKLDYTNYNLINEDLNQTINNDGSIPLSMVPRGLQKKVQYKCIIDYIMVLYAEMMTVYKRDAFRQMISWITSRIKPMNKGDSMNNNEIDPDTTSKLGNDSGDESDYGRGKNKRFKKPVKKLKLQVNNSTNGDVSTTTTNDDEEEVFVAMDSNTRAANKVSAIRDMDNLISFEQPIGAISYAFPTSAPKPLPTLNATTLYNNIVEDSSIKDSQQNADSTKPLQLGQPQPRLFPFTLVPKSEFAIKRAEVMQLLSLSPIKFDLYPGLLHNDGVGYDSPFELLLENPNNASILVGLTEVELDFTQDELDEYMSGFQLPRGVTLNDIMKLIKQFQHKHPCISYSQAKNQYNKKYAKNIFMNFNNINSLYSNDQGDIIDDDIDMLDGIDITNAGGNSTPISDSVTQNCSFDHQIHLLEQRDFTYTQCFTPPTRIKLLNYAPLIQYFLHCLYTHEQSQIAHIKRLIPSDNDVWVPECYVCHQFCYNGFVMCADQLFDLNIDLTTFVNVWTVSSHHHKASLSQVRVTCPYHSTTEMVCSCSSSTQHRYSCRNILHEVNHATETNTDTSNESQKIKKVIPFQPLISAECDPTDLQLQQFHQHIKYLNDLETKNKSGPSQSNKPSIVKNQDNINITTTTTQSSKEYLNHLIIEKTTYHTCQQSFYFYRFDVEDLELIKQFAFGNIEAYDEVI